MNDIISERRDELQQMGLRERKKRLAQAAIEEAALRLFQQRGYEQTSIQEIADAVMMSPRTFFRYFASKEELLSVPMQAALDAGISYLQGIPPMESPTAALTATFVYIASLYQHQRASFLIRYQVAMVTPPLVSIYLYSLAAAEPTICEALFTRPETSMSRKYIRLLVAIYMAALRVALELWLENEANGDLVSLLREHLERLSYLPQEQEKTL